MFSFSASSILLGFASMLLAAVSPVTLKLLAAAGAVLIVGWFELPARFRIIAVALAVSLAAFAGAWQAAEADGARRMLQRDHALALQAERDRAAAADAITRDLAEQATRDLADAQADNAKLKELNDALSRDPRGAHPADSHDLARRLRSL